MSEVTKPFVILRLRGTFSRLNESFTRLVLHREKVLRKRKMTGRLYEYPRPDPTSLTHYFTISPSLCEIIR
ncbi:hypothetical protein GCM10011378_24950 [Hymenobacter glacieicola]|uniref:Uncharacterized protein n=1 Tax=Hymenobacter glacieicola TaxID=1562124 RepID=A0ABQ1WVY4_9BACT|nr:hypothetical protein GCM10011378_24950 [Hymenobacter glacieicola]